MKMSAAAASDHIELKVVGKSGQISLGKRFAGKTLCLERRADGTVLLTAVAMVPEPGVRKPGSATEATVSLFYYVWRILDGT